jgi:cyclomaltodextrinase / maltogenic alpha-amylase / neopullulanase
VKEDRAGGDDAVRPAFPAGPDELSPLGEPVLRPHQRLIALRRRKPWLASGRYEQVAVTNDSLVYRVTAPDGGDSVTVALNVGDGPLDVGPGPGERLLEGGTGPHEAAVFGRD